MPWRRSRLQICRSRLRIFGARLGGFPPYAAKNAARKMGHPFPWHCLLRQIQKDGLSIELSLECLGADQDYRSADQDYESSVHAWVVSHLTRRKTRRERWGTPFRGTAYFAKYKKMGSQLSSR